jgi:hypothetical protein
MLVDQKSWRIDGRVVDWIANNDDVGRDGVIAAKCRRELNISLCGSIKRNQMRILSVFGYLEAVATGDLMHIPFARPQMP